MDIPRPDQSIRTRRRHVTFFAVTLSIVAVATLGLSKLNRAAPAVERSSLWIGVVKKGPLVRQAYGLGSLVPEEIRWIPALTDGTVERIRVLPGTAVKADTVILELSNPTLEQQTLEAESQLQAGEAELKNSLVRIQSDIMAQRSAAATVSADYNEARMRAETDTELAKWGVISELSLKVSKGKAQELATRHELEQQRLEIVSKSEQSQLAVQQAKVEQLRALAKLKRRQLDSLKVRAEADGILQEMSLQVGQSVTLGTTLAKVAQPEHLKAELRIPEVQAKDIQLGQQASIDTHNGIIRGTVVRIDPGSQNGTVAVDVKLYGALPKGARPALSVDGTVDLERAESVLYLTRTSLVQENTKISMFRIDLDGKGAVRVPLKIGRSSVTDMEILEGLKENDQVILSDMSRWDNVDRVRLY